MGNTNIDESTKVIDAILRAFERTSPFYVELMEDSLK